MAVISSAHIRRLLPYRRQDVSWHNASTFSASSSTSSRLRPTPLHHSSPVFYIALDAVRLQFLSIRQFHQSLLCHHGFFFAALWTFHGATPRLAQLPHLPLRASVRRLYTSQHPSSTLRSTPPASNPIQSRHRQKSACIATSGGSSLNISYDFVLIFKFSIFN